MRRSLPLVFGLMLGLGLLTLMAGGVAGWKGRDLAELRAALTELTRDACIIGFAACALDASLFVHSDNYPMQFNCQQLVSQVFSAGGLFHAERS